MSVVMFIFTLFVNIKEDIEELYAVVFTAEHHKMLANFVWQETKIYNEEINSINNY